MPLTQEKRFDSNITNNNDHNYLHKKFKKMASTSLECASTTAQTEELRQRDIDIPQVPSYNTLISNRSIAAAHPEIEKIKTPPSLHIKSNVQINFNEENRISDVNNIEMVTGKTSHTQEFSNKTDNTENEYKDVQNGGTGGRYICPYCKLSCAKPSVLQKHIRAHTNERPYPCVPCGFAFKTKSNLYKHRRSRTHALRLQGADVSATTYDEDMSGGSESDTSLPPPNVSESGSDTRLELSRPSEFSSPELFNERISPPTTAVSSDCNKMKSIYKPKFRAAFYPNIDDCDKNKKTLSSNADFLTEHISKIISDNEAIVDDIEMPLQKKYGKIKQIAESKQYLNECNETKFESSPLNLTKSNSSENEHSFRKRSHSETFSHNDSSKHPLNPEGSIIKDLLLKTKGNGLVSITGELIDSLGPLFVCPVCQIIYRSADNLETHRFYYCKGNNASAAQVSPRETKNIRPENTFVRSNSINVRLPENQSVSFNKLNQSQGPIIKNKPDNLIITKPETNEVIAPLPSPGPLLGNTRLVDTRGPDFTRKTEHTKAKPISSPKRKLDSRSDTYSPRSLDNNSPRSLSDMYPQAKIRCMEANPVQLRSLDDLPQHIKHNSTSLQMFGGEVKIVDHSGGTTTLRIEPSKNQLSPILLHPNLSPSKLADLEASSVVVRSGLHSGGTITHNPPTPKEGIISMQPQTPRSAKVSINGITNPNLPNVQGIFQFPPLSAITAYNPLTLPPLSPSTSVNGATTILHGGKLIPHVPGIPGPNTPGIYIGTSTGLLKNSHNEANKSNLDSSHDIFIKDIKQELTVKRDKSPNPKGGGLETVQQVYNVEAPKYLSAIPTIKIKNVDETSAVSKVLPNNIKPTTPLQDNLLKRNVEGFIRSPVLKESPNFPVNKTNAVEKNRENNFKNTILIRPVTEARNFNFENLITKAEIYNNQVQSSMEAQKSAPVSRETAKSPVLTDSQRSETLYFQKNCNAKSSTDDRKPKFLRPSTLPLKPGTFTPKKHHGITPNANTMPLVSPETPRPAKAYGQLYLNGNAYTYLGLKCSTKVSYCTINRPQPTYVPNQHFLSMYSNWQLLSELTPDPLGLSASTAMSLYDSRHRPQNNTVAVMKQDLILTHSSKWNTVTKEEKKIFASSDIKKMEDSKMSLSDGSNQSKKELTGGFESNEEYTYVRGRGRGRYVCSECGIRCKKPSMLKKHIRTHTDVRPYTCVHCAFSFKTKGNLTKHMKSKAHYKKCCELGITPIEGNDTEVEMAQCSGETDDDTESDGDEGNEGETESSDTEICKSRLPEHEAAHCLLSLGGNTVTTSNTPGLITSARPSTYPYAPTNANKTLLSPMRIPSSRNSSVDSRTDSDNEPMDLSKNEVKCTYNIPEIPTARESSVLASLASNTAKLPQPQIQWSNGEPMLHTYLTERALLDSKIKQSQVTSSLSKVRKLENEKSIQSEKCNSQENTNNTITTVKASIQMSVPPSNNPAITTNISAFRTVTSEKTILLSTSTKVDNLKDVSDSNVINMNRLPSNSKAENAKHVVSEYLKHTRINTLTDNTQNVSDISEGSGSTAPEEKIKVDELKGPEIDLPKLSPLDHDPVARKVVIGAGGVAFKVTKGKEYDGSATYTPGKLMEDGRRVCDFCNKTFTKPSQLRLHLNIHYMERPFRCSACAVSFRTRGHLQKHERSGSHHNKVSMTSTFGAATSLNPRPFRCSDCNIAFRIHGHLAKHLRSKMHVMRLECLFKLPFGTFTEIERAGLSLTDIDTTDCASSLASLQSLARKLHEKDPTKLEYRDPGSAVVNSSVTRESSDEEENASGMFEREKESELKIDDQNEGPSNETSVNTSATDN